MSDSQAEFLPTPSSSYSPTTPLSHRGARPKKYGSFLYQAISDDSLSFEDAPPTPPHTTVSPNDDDEGLYLLWTHQLLREQGLRPASCRTNSYHEDEHQDNNDDDDDDESSQTESMTSIPYQHAKLPSEPSFFSTAFSFVSSFPFCTCPSS